MFHNRTAAEYSLSKPVFYREALMYVEYLREVNPKAFQTALQAIMRGEDFQDSFKSAYGASIASYWPPFIESMKPVSSQMSGQISSQIQEPKSEQNQNKVK